MLTLSDIRSRVRTRFEALSTTRWSNSDIDEAINSGLEELAEATSYFERTVSVPLKQGRTYYDLRGLVPETCLSVTAVWHGPGNRWLTPADNRDLSYVEWEKVIGNPISWFTRGLFWLGLWPHPSSDVDEWVRVFYCGLPAKLVDDGDIPEDLPQDHVEALEDYAIYELLGREGETEKSLKWWQRYRQREYLLANQVDHRVSRARSGRIGRA